jgi:hypothetical protein
LQGSQKVGGEIFGNEGGIALWIAMELEDIVSAIRSPNSGGT